MTSDPNFNDEFLSALMKAQKKRQKAISYKVESYSIDRVLDKSDSGQLEKLEIEYKLYLNKITLRFYFWEDRYSWIDIREPSKKGWAFEWGLNGRVGSTSAQSIFLAIEQSIDESRRLGDSSKDKLNELWGAILLRGPMRT